MSIAEPRTVQNWGVAMRSGVPMPVTPAQPVASIPPGRDRGAPGRSPDVAHTEICRAVNQGVAGQRAQGAGDVTDICLTVDDHIGREGEMRAASGNSHSPHGNGSGEGCPGTTRGTRLQAVRTISGLAAHGAQARDRRHRSAEPGVRGLPGDYGRTAGQNEPRNSSQYRRLRPANFHGRLPVRTTPSTFSARRGATGSPAASVPSGRCQWSRPASPARRPVGRCHRAGERMTLPRVTSSAARSRTSHHCY